MNNRAGISERPFNLSLATSVSSFHLRGGIVETKKCCKCERDLPLDQFNKNIKSKDGLRSQCKSCRSESRKIYNQKNKVRIKEHNRKYREANRDRLNERDRLYKSRNIKRGRAHTFISYQLSTGKMIRPESCSQCGVKCKPEGHHKDYDKPAEVIWLCKSCHRRLHLAQEWK